LETSITGKMTQKQMQEYETIDRLRMQHAKIVEANCKKMHKGNVPYSDELQKIRNKIEGWSLLLKRKKGLKVSSRKVSRSLKKANIPEHTKNYTTTEVKDELELATKEYYKLKKSAKELRETYLTRLATAISSQGNLKKANIIKQLRLREQQRSTARKIKYIRGRLSRQSTTMVTIKQQDRSTIELLNRKEMEKAIVKSNKNKFLQSFGTDFYKHPYNKLFGYQGLTRSSQRVLDSNFQPPQDASTHMIDFLAHLAMPRTIKENPNQMEMTLDSFVSYWRKAREHTSCYPSPFCFATLKASSHDSYLANMDCVMTRIPIKTGYSPTCWQRCVDVMIPKKSNMTDIDNLRTICLFEVNANYCFKHTEAGNNIRLLI
jgi:hypothetical protein